MTAFLLIWSPKKWPWPELPDVAKRVASGVAVTDVWGCGFARSILPGDRVFPGYANYTLGKLMILKLRKDYRAQEGAVYSLEKFHNEFLRHGMPPVPLLREILLKDKQLWDKAL